MTLDLPLPLPRDAKLFHDGGVEVLETDSNKNRSEEDHGNSSNSKFNLCASNTSWKLRFPILALILLFNMGCIVANNVLPQMKHLLMENMSNGDGKISAAQFGVISAANSFINAILPIIAGIITDYYGPTYVSLICSTFIMIGTIVEASGAQSGSFFEFLGGEILMAVGTTSIMGCQMKLYTYWFHTSKQSGQGMIGFIVGLAIGMKRVYSTIGHQSAIPIKNATNKWYWAFWLSAILSAVSFISTVAYAIIEHTFLKKTHVERQERVARAAIVWPRKREARGALAYVRSNIDWFFRGLKELPASFWIMTLLQTLQAGAISSFESNSTDVIRLTRHLSEYRAAYISGLDRIIPIVMTPIIGLVFDYAGHRPFFVSYTAALYIVVYCLTIFTQVNELCPILLGSLALSSFEIPFVATIPLLLPSLTHVATAYGVWEAYTSAGNVIMNVTTGALQDRKINKLQRPSASMYNDMFYFLIALKSLEVLIGLLYYVLDHRYFGDVMTMSERQRAQNVSRTASDRANRKLCVPSMTTTVLGCTMTAAMILTSYVLFIYYSL